MLIVRLDMLVVDGHFEDGVWRDVVQYTADFVIGRGRCERGADVERR